MWQTQPSSRIFMPQSRTTVSSDLTFFFVCEPDKPSSCLMMMVCLSILMVIWSSHCLEIIKAGDERSSLHSVPFCGTYSVSHLHHQISVMGFPSLPLRRSSLTTWWNSGFASVISAFLFGPFFHSFQNTGHVNFLFCFKVSYIYAFGRLT